MSVIVTKPKATKNEKNRNYTVKTPVEKLTKISKISIFYFALEMKRYFKNIDILISYRCIDITSLASLALTFSTLRDVRVKGSRVLRGCRLVLSAKFKYTLEHIIVFIFNPHSRIFSGVWKEASTSVNTFGEVCNFWKKKKIQNFDYPAHRLLKITNARALFSLSYVRPCLTLAPRGLRTHGKSVESCTRIVSSCVTLAKRTWRERKAGIKNNRKLQQIS